MALHLPKPRSKSVPQKTTGLDGMKVKVSAAAADGVAKSQETSIGLAGLTSQVSIKQLRDEVGKEGLRRAAIDATGKEPSDRTLRRWVQQDRIPNPQVAEVARRRAAVERLGGVDAVAAKIGRTASSVRKYQSGQTNELRNDAKSKLKAARALDTMLKAGVIHPDGTPKVASIEVRGLVHVRNGDETGYDYRTRTLNFANSETEFTAEESWELAVALAADDQARAVAILERHATLDYPESKGFDKYGDKFGFHFENIEKLDVTWH